MSPACRCRPGALRQALLDARAGDTIIFDATVFPPAEPMTISVTTALPDLSQGDLTLDASQGGVVLDGSALAAGISGLRIVSDGNRVQGLRITRFPGHGIEITAHARFNVIGGGGRAGNTLTRNDGAGIALLTTASTNVLLGNYLGTTADHGALGNQWGILCLGEAQDNVVLNNVIGFNRADGIRLDGCHHTLISGNHIGTGVDGVSDLGNAQAGVQLLNGAHHNRIGPDNVIAYNRTDGVHLLHATTAANTITRNLISVHPDSGLWSERAGHHRDGDRCPGQHERPIAGDGEADQKWERPVRARRRLLAGARAVGRWRRAAAYVSCPR
ncbi:MAG: right-handed parallel beta-helix repeat-containing protein [Anaerolineae bacterium]|uniref:right-handed parallel beta-helix repeat-containing protein n=1 Tax=Candidatus Amarolinea dominans TaxID=3140696 RepID=UPI0031371F36|nr:right-handed parallel beta-helix repeat-containing protein [Anaerolineae bacterium]